MSRALKFCGILILHLLVALFGTGVLESTIGALFHPHSLGAVLWKMWILSPLCAAVIGFYMWRTWRTPAAVWVWVLPGLWFALLFIPALVAGASRGVLGEGVWREFSGSACADGVHSLGCLKFFVGTIPLVCGVAYSIGAYVSSLVYEAGPIRQLSPEASAPDGPQSRF